MLKAALLSGGREALSRDMLEPFIGKRGLLLVGNRQERVKLLDSYSL